MLKNYTKAVSGPLFTLFLLFLGLTNFTFSQNMYGTQVFEKSGSDNDVTGLVVNVANDITVNQGQSIVSLTISDFSEIDTYWGDCGYYFGFNVVVDGITLVTEGCYNEIVGLDVTGANVIEINPVDLDDYDDEYNIQIVFDVEYVAPSCLAITNPLTVSSTDTQVVIGWSAETTQTNFIVVYGLPGFTSGQELGTINVNQNQVEIIDLSPNTTYVAKVQVDCGEGDSSSIVSYIFKTSCGTFDGTDFCESFNADSPTRDCWTIIDANGDGYQSSYYTDYMFFYDEYDGDEYATINPSYYSGNDDYLISPQIAINGSNYIKIRFTPSSNFKLKMSSTGIDPADFTTTIFENNTIDWYSDWVDTIIALDGITGNVYFAFHADDYTEDYFSIDNFCIGTCVFEPGTDGSVNVCREDQNIDLNSIITSPYQIGSWKSNSLQSLINGSILDFSPLAAGSYEFQYVVKNDCSADTTVATIVLFDRNEAGVGTLLQACKDQNIDLFSGISGSAQLGGTWYKPDGSEIAGTMVNPGSLVGQFVYKYVVSNTVCPNDTAFVTLNVTSCPLSIDDASTWDGVNIFPNPTSGKVKLTGLSIIDNQTVEVLDLNGRVIVEKMLIQGEELEIDLSAVVTGVYLIKLDNGTSNTMHRVIKQ